MRRPADGVRHPPRPVSIAAAVTGLEALGLLAVDMVYGYDILTGRPGDRGSALLGAGMGLGVALLLGALARGLARMRRPALTPVVLANLLALPVGVGLLQGRLYLAGVVVLACAVSVSVLLFGNRDARDAFR